MGGRGGREELRATLSQDELLSHMVLVICWAHFSLSPLLSPYLKIHEAVRDLGQSLRLRKGETTETQISSCFIPVSLRRLVCSEAEVRACTVDMPEDA